MISEVIVTMFNKPTTPFWTGRAMDLFFDGMIFNEFTKKDDINILMTFGLTFGI